MKTLQIALLLMGPLVLAALPTRADKAGEALLQKCLDAETKAQSIDAKFTHQFKENGMVRIQSGTLQLKKPNLAHIVVVSAKKETAGNVIINSDGKNFVTYSQSDNDYAREAADMGGGNIARNNILETALFFNPDMLNRLRSLAIGVKVAGQVSVGNVLCQVLRFDGIPRVALKLDIGPDGLVRGTTKVFNGDNDETHLTDLKSNAALRQTAFRWQPPRGARTVQEVAASIAQQTTGSETAQAVSLLPVGRRAPSFSLEQYRGGNLTLASEIRAHRAIVLNFWSYF